MLDDGRLTDNQGRTVDFKNTIVIMTSNIGSHDLIENMKDDGTIDEQVSERVTGQLKNYFRPEFLNRIDDIILFSPLTKVQIIEIITLALSSLEKRLSQREMKLELTDVAKNNIADEAYDAHYGARPVKRYLQKHIETEIASMIIRGDVMDGQTVLIDCDEKGLIFGVK